MAGRFRLTDAQFAVLECLWTDGPQTIRQITTTLYPSLTDSDYATVQKLLGQLEEKDCATRDRSTSAHIFRASAYRADLIDSQLQDMADKLCGGSVAPVLMRLLESTHLSRAERDALRKFVESSARLSRPAKGTKQ